MCSQTPQIAGGFSLLVASAQVDLAEPPACIATTTIAMLSGMTVVCTNTALQSLKKICGELIGRWSMLGDMRKVGSRFRETFRKPPTHRCHPIADQVSIRRRIIANVIQDEESYPHKHRHRHMHLPIKTGDQARALRARQPKTY